MSCPAQEKGHRCSCLSCAGHRVPQCIVLIFQMTPRLRVDYLAHSSRSRVTGQAQVIGSYLTPGHSRASGLGYCLFLHLALESLLETCRHFLTRPVVVEGKGTGVWFGRLTRKVSPRRKAEARMPGQAAWVSEQPLAPISSGQHLPSELWPGAGHTGDQAQPASRWSWGKEGRLGAGTMGPQICPSPKQGRRQGGSLTRPRFRACTSQAWRKATAEPYV